MAICIAAHSKNKEFSGQNRLPYSCCLCTENQHLLKELLLRYLGLQMCQESLH